MSTLHTSSNHRSSRQATTRAATPITTDPAATQNMIFCRASLAYSGALVLAHGRAEGFQGPVGLGGERPGMDLQALGLLEDDRQVGLEEEAITTRGPPMVAFRCLARNFFISSPAGSERSWHAPRRAAKDPQRPHGGAAAPTTPRGATPNPGPGPRHGDRRRRTVAADLIGDVALQTRTIQSRSKARLPFGARRAGRPSAGCGYGSCSSAVRCGRGCTHWP